MALTFQEVDELAILCDKYDTVRIVRPWHTIWIPDGMRCNAGYSGNERWLFVAYTFGFSGIFEMTAKQMVLTCKTNKHGKCLRANGEYLQGDFPSGIIGELRTTPRPHLAFHDTYDLQPILRPEGVWVVIALKLPGSGAVKSLRSLGLNDMWHSTY